jgi:hypothetical protein
MADLSVFSRAGKLVAGPAPAYAYATSYSQDSTTNVFSSISGALSSTGGKEYLTCSITPKRADSRLEIDICVPNLSTSAVMHSYLALFKDSETTSRQVVSHTAGVAGYFGAASLKYILPSTGSTSAQTWRLRFGSNSTGTIYVANRAGVNEFGNTDITTFRIQEVYL